MYISLTMRHVPSAWRATTRSEWLSRRAMAPPSSRAEEAPARRPGGCARRGARQDGAMPAKVPPGLEKRGGGAQTAERALAVLACFKTAPGTLGLTQIARRLNLSPSVVHRLLHSLVAFEFLEQDLDTAQYRLGQGLAFLTEVFVRQRHFDLVESELRHLSTVAGGSAGIAARDG